MHDMRYLIKLHNEVWMNMKNIIDCIYSNYPMEWEEIEASYELMDSKFKMIVKDLSMYTSLLEDTIKEKYDSWKEEYAEEEKDEKSIANDGKKSKEKKNLF